MDNTITLALLAIVLTVILVSSIIRSYNSFIYNKENIANEQKISTDRMRILLEDKAVDKIDEVLDNFIHNAAGIYQILALPIENKEYLRQEDIDKMTGYISTMVLKNMTPEVVSLLSLTHVFDSAEDLSELINLRTKLYVLNFVVSYNDLQK